MEKREAPSKRPRMFGGLESGHWIIQSIGLPIGLSLLPTAAMASKSKDELMVTPVLVRLIRIRLRPTIWRRLHAWRSNECQANGVVARLVGSILTIGEKRDAKAARFIGNINPSVRCNLKLTLLSI